MAKFYNEISVDMNPESSTFEDVLSEDSFEYKGDLMLMQDNPSGDFDFSNILGDFSGGGVDMELDSEGRLNKLTPEMFKDLNMHQAALLIAKSLYPNEENELVALNNWKQDLGIDEDDTRAGNEKLYKYMRVKFQIQPEEMSEEDAAFYAQEQASAKLKYGTGTEGDYGTEGKRLESIKETAEDKYESDMLLYGTGAEGDYGTQGRGFARGLEFAKEQRDMARDIYDIEGSQVERGLGGDLYGLQKEAKKFGAVSGEVSRGRGSALRSMKDLHESLSMGLGSTYDTYSDRMKTVAGDWERAQSDMLRSQDAYDDQMLQLAFDRKQAKESRLEAKDAYDLGISELDDTRASVLASIAKDKAGAEELLYEEWEEALESLILGPGGI